MHPNIPCCCCCCCCCSLKEVVKELVHISNEGAERLGLLLFLQLFLLPVLLQ
jgi:hypothetical protein